MRARLRPLLMCQLALGAVVLPLLAFWPPASGAMLLVGVPGVSTGAMVNAALAGGGAVLGTGPVQGSLVVRGDRARIAHAIGRRGVLILAAPFVGCGAPGGSGA